MGEVTGRAFDQWLASMFAQGSDEKIVLCGSRFFGIATGCYDPAHWPRLTGNAHQRRMKRRYLSRMWEATRESVEKLRHEFGLTGPSRTLGKVW